MNCCCSLCSPDSKIQLRNLRKAGLCRKCLIKLLAIIEMHNHRNFLILKTLKEKKKLEKEKEALLLKDKELPLRKVAVNNNSNWMAGAVFALSRQIRVLKSLYPLNDLFSIWRAGDLGTISNLRLGSTEEEGVPVKELNAALAEVAFLIIQIESKLKQLTVISNTTFPHFKLKYNGASTTLEIKVKDQWQVVPLQAPDLNNVGKSWWVSKKLHLNEPGLLALFESYFSICQRFEIIDPQLKPPFLIERELQVEYSESEWNSLFRNLGINLKWIIAQLTKIGI